MAMINWYDDDDRNEPMDSPPINTAEPVETAPYTPPDISPSAPPTNPWGNGFWADATKWAQIDQGYQTLLGRPRDPTDVQFATDPNWYSNLAQSQEAQNYAQRARPPVPPSPVSPPPLGGGGDPRSLWMQWYQSTPTKPRQSQNASLQPFVDHLRQQGLNAEVNVDPHGYGKGINLNGRFVKLLDGYDNPIWQEDTGSGGQGGAGPSPVSSYMAQFNDPSTKLLEQYITDQLQRLSGQQTAQDQANVGLRRQMAGWQETEQQGIGRLENRVRELEAQRATQEQANQALQARQTGAQESSDRLVQYLNQQMAALEAQRATQEQANQRLRARQGEAQQASERLVAYLNQRATQLQGAPYTGAEQEILRTHALDPIERDRTAANKRTLEGIGARGLTPESGIVQELSNQVNSVFDRLRASAQNELAYRTINEQRSRGQEAQQLLAAIPQIERAGAAGDLELLQALDAAANQPRLQGLQLSAAIPQLQRAGVTSDLALSNALRDAVNQPAGEALQLQSAIPRLKRSGAMGDLSFLQALDAAANAPGQQAINLATANQRLPSQAMQDALSVMGMGGSGADSVFQQAMGLYGVQNQQQQQGLGYYQMLGSLLPYLIGGQ